MEIAVQFLLMLVVLKSLLLGSDFHFGHLLRHGSRYWEWYHNRETFDEFLESEG